MACGHVVEVNGVTTTVREARPGDVDRLLDLYGRLSPDDTHRRFFSGSRPDQAWIEKWIEKWIVRSDGGVVLVAVEGDEDTGLAVAGYVPTGADMAELAMTVDPLTDADGWGRSCSTRSWSTLGRAISATSRPRCCREPCHVGRAWTHAPMPAAERRSVPARRRRCTRVEHDDLRSAVSPGGQLRAGGVARRRRWCGEWSRWRRC